MHFKQLIAVACVIVSLDGAAAGNGARQRALDDDAWRADITTVAEAIREFHPNPFRTTTADDFDQRYQALLADVPGLSDKEVIVRLAGLVALVHDGHTRLSIPRQHPELGLEFGHTPTPGPDIEALEFRQLPLAFEQFADGIFVIAARADLADLVGHRLVAIDDTDADAALAAVQAITYAENVQLEGLMGADRLSLPEALAALGISRSAEQITLTLAGPDGGLSRRAVTPLDAGPIAWRDAFADRPVPLRNRHAERKFWSEYVADGNYVYLQMDEIADDDVTLAGFVTSAVQTAIAHDARLVIDIRNNFGGSGGLNKTLVMSIIRNDDLNRYDRTFVLIGPRTFSAAQMLVNDLEQYTRVTFVGEPTGSRPDHYGDPKKIRLAHSGLTLRVSRLHWSSYNAFDERTATMPDFVAACTSDAYFGGRDPALELAVSLQDVGLEQLLRNSIPRAEMTQIGRYLLDSRTAPDTWDDDFSGVLLDLGAEFEQAGDRDAASLSYQLGLYFYPANRALTDALATLDAEIGGQ